MFPEITRVESKQINSFINIQVTTMGFPVYIKFVLQLFWITTPVRVHRQTTMNSTFCSRRHAYTSRKVTYPFRESFNLLWILPPYLKYRENNTPILYRKIRLGFWLPMWVFSYSSCFQEFILQAAEPISKRTTTGFPSISQLPRIM